METNEQARTQEDEINKLVDELDADIMRDGPAAGGLALVPEEKRREILRAILTYSHPLDDENPVGIDLLEELRRRISMPDPLTMDDETLSAHLGKAIEVLAQFHFQLQPTNHLSDRELYQRLLDDLLLEPLAIRPGDKSCVVFHDVCSSLVDSENFLRYFADEVDLELWRCDNDGEIPDRCPLKSDRDDAYAELVEECRTRPVPQPISGLVPLYRDRGVH